MSDPDRVGETVPCSDQSTQTASPSLHALFSIFIISSAASTTTSLDTLMDRAIELLIIPVPKARFTEGVKIL